MGEKGGGRRDERFFFAIKIVREVWVLTRLVEAALMYRVGCLVEISKVRKWYQSSANPRTLERSC